MAVGGAQDRAADGAGLRLGAGGGRAGGVPRGGNGHAVFMPAALAGIDLDAVRGAGGLYKDGPRIIAVAEGGDAIRRIAVAAAGAGVGGIAVRQAGRRGHGGNIVVAQGVGVIAPVAVVAILADIGGVAHRFAGGFGDSRGVTVALGRSDHRAADGAELGVGAGGGETGFVTGSVDGLQIAGIAAGAAMLHNARAVAGGAGNDRSLVPIMAEGREIVVNVAVVAAGAGVGGIAHFRAGGRGNDGGVAVTQGVGVFATVACAAVDAGVGGVAHALAGGSGDRFRVVMAGGLGQHRAADGAELGLGAGSGGAGLVICGRDGLALADAAGFAGVLLHALADAGGRSHHLAGVPAVALGFGVIVCVGLTAAVTDLERHTARDAGSRGDIALVAVAQHRADVGDPTLSAAGTLRNGIAGAGAGGGDGAGLPGVFAFCRLGHAGLAAALADVQDLAAMLAVGLADDHGLPGMAGGVDVVALLDKAADGAEPAVIAQGGAGGTHRVDEDEVVDAALAIKLEAMGTGAVLAVAVGISASAGAALKLRQGLVPQPDVSDAVFLHAHALIGVGDGIVDRVFALVGVAGRRGHRAGVGAVAVADDGVDAGLGEIGHSDGVSLSVHHAVIVRDDGLRRDKLVVGIVAQFAVGHNGKPLVAELGNDVRV